MHAQEIHTRQTPLTLGGIEVHLVLSQPCKHGPHQHRMLLQGVTQIVDVLTHDIWYASNNVLHEQLIAGRSTLQTQARYIEII